MSTLPNPFFAGDEPSPAETAVASLSLPGLGDATADRFVLDTDAFMAAIEPPAMFAAELIGVLAVLAGH